MSTLNLSVDLHNLKENQLNALAGFVYSFRDPSAVLVPGNVGAVTEEQPTEEKKTRAKRGSKVQAGAFEGQERTESDVDKYEAAKEVEVKEPETVQAEDDDIMGDPEETLTFDDIRALTSKITQESKDGLAALKGKLTELKCAKLVDLKDKTDKWQEFYDFALSLK